MKKSFNIKLSGCDDSVSVVHDLTFAQLALLQEIARKVNDAGEDSSCMSTLLVWLVGTQEPDPYPPEHYGEDPTGGAT